MKNFHSLGCRKKRFDAKTVDDKNQTLRKLRFALRDGKWIKSKEFAKLVKMGPIGQIHLI